MNVEYISYFSALKKEIDFLTIGNCESKTRVFQKQNSLKQVSQNCMSNTCLLFKNT
jgi:hypothetical protein